MARRLNFHTGEFARIVGVNKRTLHYYDEQGIFSPSAVEDNGYRSYSFRQLWSFFLIRMMRSMGLELGEIKGYMQNRSPEGLSLLLSEQEKWLEGEIKSLRRQLRIVKNQHMLLENAQNIRCDVVTEVDLPETLMMLSENMREAALAEDWPRIDTISAWHVRELLDLKKEAGLGVGAMVSVEDVLAGRESAMSYLFSVTDVSLQGVPQAKRHIRPAGHYVRIYFRGDYYETTESYRRLLAYLQAHALTPVGYSYEESIIDEMSAPSPEGYMTRMVIPVK